MSAFRSTPFLALVAVVSAATLLPACTTAIISGKATPDGRPILWKNRDASDLHNQIVRCEDGRYAYVGVTNEGDPGGLQIWSGLNEAGFSIMNNASYNLATRGEESTQEGTFMKLALQSCATVEDFQKLLDRTPGSGRQVSANFGVIDAKGGAAYFETDEKGYRRFDAAAAPGGFLVRTNYSHSGKKGGGTGYLREARAQDLVGKLQASGRLTVETLLAEVARDTANPHIDSFPAQTRRGFAYVGDSICRHGASTTTNTFVVRGVQASEAPGRSTGWVILGQPASGVAVPFWVDAGNPPAELMGNRGWAPLHATFDQIRHQVFPGPEDDRQRYLDAARAYHPATGIVPALLTLEHRNFSEVERELAGPHPDLRTLEDALARRTLEAVRELASPK